MSIALFITIMVPLVGGFLWLISYINNKATLTATSLKYVEKELNEVKVQNVQDQTDIKGLKEQRHRDFIEFTKVLAEFSNSITEFRLTLKHLDETLKEVKAEIKNNNINKAA